ncbi:neutral zinc metallopeptidase [Nocardia sp. NPDC127579]|uniref:neutral zinc metallopeptidase n=1 Tax=Nocardia sp. NPDC127579 TaxID=3345402 RepID=UPI00363514E1
MQWGRGGPPPNAPGGQGNAWQSPFAAAAPRNPPPPRGSRGVIVLIVALVVATIAVGVGVYLVSGSDSRSSDQADVTVRPTPTTISSTQLTPSPTTTTRTAIPSSTVPRWTKPVEPQPVLALGDNPLFSKTTTGLISSPCNLPGWGADITSAKSFFMTASGCAGKMWQNLLTNDNGLPYAPPTVRVLEPGGAAQTNCTGATANFSAFYCPTDKTIVLPTGNLQTGKYGNNWGIYLAVFAHEYAHHAQELAGITAKMNQERAAAGARTARGLEISRRYELQAQCFSGMFITALVAAGSLTADQARAVIGDQYGRGDDGEMSDHGSNEHYGAWFEQGYKHNRVAQCNTWTVSADQVT